MPSSTVVIQWVAVIAILLMGAGLGVFTIVKGKSMDTNVKIIMWGVVIFSIIIGIVGILILTSTAPYKRYVQPDPRTWDSVPYDDVFIPEFNYEPYTDSLSVGIIEEIQGVYGSLDLVIPERRFT